MGQKFKHKVADWWQKHKVDIFVTTLVGGVATGSYFLGRNNGKKSINLEAEGTLAKSIFDDYNDAICDLADQTTIAVQKGEDLPELTIGNRRLNILDANEVQFWD